MRFVLLTYIFEQKVNQIGYNFRIKLSRKYDFIGLSAIFIYA